MKKLLLIILWICGIPCSQAQQMIDLRSGKLEREIASTVPTRNIEKIEDGYIVNYSFEKALIQPDELFSGTSFWKIDGFGLNQAPGDPCTLVRNDMVAIPVGYRAKIEVIDSTYNDFSYELTPARQPQIDSDDKEYTKQNVLAIKSYDGFKPSYVVSHAGVQSYRGRNLCQVAISPIQYNHNRKIVRAYTSITYKVSFIPNNMRAGTSRTVSAHLSTEDNFLINNVIGGDQEDTSGMEKANGIQDDTRDYLILSTTEYSAAANRFAEWKKLMGFRVHVVICDDWTNESVMSAVADAYTEYASLYYLLIIGDYDDVPAQTSVVGSEHVTDFHYGCMDNDYIPEIYCGRLSVSSPIEANNIVEKIIGYEKTPPISMSFYTKALHCAYFQDLNSDSYADRRFAQTSEDVRTYVISQGKSIQRVYKTPSSVTPKYWNNGSYSYGESIPNDLKKPNFAWNGNYNDINNSINQGVFYVLHRDHGNVSSWGDPLYTQQYISSLTNGNLLPVVFSMNCLTGKFDENCFAETFLRHPEGGCVAIYAASEESYSGYNDALTTGMFDAIWPVPGLSIHIPNHNNSFSVTPTATYTLGQILNQGKVRLAETYGANSIYTRYTDEIFHCFGDPSMRIYTTNPTAFSDVSIERSDNSIAVNVESDDAARITFYNPVSGEVQSYVGTSATVTTCDPYETTVCISAHNRIPYIQQPDIRYLQNTTITGTLNETHDVIKVGNHVTTMQDAGDVSISNADITLKAKKVVLDCGTNISTGSILRTVNP